MLSRLVHDNQFRIIPMLDQRNHPAQGVTQHRLAIERAYNDGNMLFQSTIEFLTMLEVKPRVLPLRDFYMGQLSDGFTKGPGTAWEEAIMKFDYHSAHPTEALFIAILKDHFLTAFDVELHQVQSAT
jgi:hypothetical protein